MEVTLNGEAREIPAGQTVQGLVESLGLDPARVAVELDRSILKRAQWSSRVLVSGDRLEIVHFVGGG